MYTIKVVSTTEEGVESSQEVKCRRFTIDDIATALEKEHLSVTGNHLDVSPIRYHFISDNAIIFLLDFNADYVMGGYAKVVNFDESQAVRDSYEDGECPDCGLPIPENVVDGESCQNCSHIFYIEED